MISRVDTSIFYPPEAHQLASYVTANPRALPGEILLAGSATDQDTIGSLVAGKMALEHFSSGLLASMNVDTLNDNNQKIQATNPQIALKALESAFKAANTSVYDFAHKLAAGGRLATTLTSVLVSHGTIAAGRVGMGGAYLSREGQLFPFFEQKKEDNLFSNAVGSNSVVPVELASVPVQPGDVLFIVSRQLDLYQEQDIAVILSDLRSYFNEVANGQDTEHTFECVCEELLARLNPGSSSQTKQQLFAMLTLLGPDSYFLTRTI